MSQKFYDDFGAWIRANHGVILNFLRSVEIPAGYDTRHAPDTESKRLMEEAGENESLSLIRAAVDDSEAPFDCRLVSTLEVRDWLVLGKRCQRVSLNEVGESLREVGFRKIPRRTHKGNHVMGPYLYCRASDLGHLSTLSPSALWAAYLDEKESRLGDVTRGEIDGQLDLKDEPTH